MGTQTVQNEAITQVNLLSDTCKETSIVTKKVESNIEGYEREKNNWMKVVLWIDEIQGYGL